MPSITYYASRLSPHILERPTSGFLICTDVPICRSGFQEYLGRELKKHRDYDAAWNLQDDEIYKVFRPPEEVTSPKTIASFQIVPVADEHPDPDLAPGSLITCENAKEFSRGCIARVRVGEPLDDGNVCLVADVHIQDEGLITKVCDKDIRDVSCGYIYRLRMKDGVLEMYDIEGNHLAVVPKGRAGSEVSISDAAPVQTNKTKELKMKNPRTRVWLEGLMALFQKDPEAATSAMDAELEEKGKPAVSEEEKAAKDKAAKDAAEKEAAEKAAKDAEVEKGAHFKAAHDCVDRLFEAHAAENKMGKDAFGNDADIPALIKELTSYFKEEEKEPQHQGADAELETLDDAAAETEEEKKAREEKEAKEKEEKEKASASDVQVIDPDTKIDDDGKAAIATSMDAAFELLKSMRPKIARIVQTPKAKRSAADQAQVDSFNTAAKALKAGRSALKADPYAALVGRVAKPELHAVADAIPTLKSPIEFYNGKTPQEGKKAWESYLASVAKEKK
jgi:hypothetical protein